MSLTSVLRALGKVIAISVGTLVLVEAGLRVTGRAPYRPAATRYQRFEPHETLGWVKRPGSFPDHQEHEDPPRDIEEHFLPLNLRASSRAMIEGGVAGDRPQLLLLGCSFTEGGGLSDEETLAWKLQERFPNLEVLNMGTSAWSTYQNLLALDELVFKAPELRNVRAVIYGLVDFHEYRNIGNALWHRELSWLSSTGSVALPSCAMRDGALSCDPPLPYPRLPLRRYLATATMLEELILTFKQRGRAETRKDVQVELLKRMKEKLAARGISFTVAYLGAVNEPKDLYVEKLRATGVDVRDCVHPEQEPGRPLADKYVIRQNGHPNRLVNDYWTECLSPVVAGMSGAGTVRTSQQ